ncbi:Protoheme IX farnesyltransferase [Trichinella spiralis]|uniref:Protoheme IX farnesyltransferase n=1 Tax=Trichinella spiralis TaxID=6334 RepID=A0ABR3K212_TRISP
MLDLWQNSVDRHNIACEIIVSILFDQTFLNEIEYIENFTKQPTRSLLIGSQHSNCRDDLEKFDISLTSGRCAAVINQFAILISIRSDAYTEIQILLYTFIVVVRANGATRIGWDGDW